MRNVLRSKALAVLVLSLLAGVVGASVLRAALTPSEAPVAPVRPAHFTVSAVKGAPSVDEAERLILVLLTELKRAGQHDDNAPQELSLEIEVTIGELGPLSEEDRQRLLDVKWPIPEKGRHIEIEWRLSSAGMKLGAIVQRNLVPEGLDAWDQFVKGAIPSASRGIRKLQARMPG